MTRARTYTPIKCSLTYLPVVDTVVRWMLLSDYRIKGILGWLKVEAVQGADTLSVATPAEEVSDGRGA
jgi:hypothetical protein